MALTGCRGLGVAWGESVQPDDVRCISEGAVPVDGGGTVIAAMTPVLGTGLEQDAQVAELSWVSVASSASCACKAAGASFVSASKVALMASESSSRANALAVSRVVG